MKTKMIRRSAVKSSFNSVNEGSRVWGTEAMTRRKADMNRAGARNLLLDKDEELDLVKKAQAGDIQARNEIIIRYQPLVTKLVNQRCQHDQSIKVDCANEATFAIDDAIRRYDVTNPKASLKGAIDMAVRKALWEYTYGIESGQARKPHGAQIGVNVEKCKRWYWQNEQRAPSIDEIETWLWEKRKLRVPREELADYAPTSLDTTYGDGDDSYTAGEVGEIARRTAYDNEHEDFSLIEDDSIIRKAFKGLDSRERDILIRMTGILNKGEMTDDDRSLEAGHIADELKMTKTRVLQIYNGAIKKLKSSGLFKEPVTRYSETPERSVADDVDDNEDFDVYDD